MGKLKWVTKSVSFSCQDPPKLSKSVSFPLAFRVTRFRLPVSGPLSNEELPQWGSKVWSLWTVSCIELGFLACRDVVKPTILEIVRIRQMLKAIFRNLGWGLEPSEGEGEPFRSRGKTRAMDERQNYNPCTGFTIISTAYVSEHHKTLTIIRLHM